MIAAQYRYGSVGYRRTVIVKHETFDAFVDLLYETDHRLLIIVPYPGEGRSVGVLVAALLYRDLKTICVNVIVILHPTFHAVPLSTVCYTMKKAISVARAGLT